jgi:hypothetical protein
MKKNIQLLISMLSMVDIPDKPHFSEKGFTDLDADKEWKCQIPKVGPYGFPSAVYHSNLKYAPCSRLEPLTYVSKTNNNPTLYINNEVAPLYSKFGIRCCYSNIERRNYTQSPDSYYRYLVFLMQSKPVQKKFSVCLFVINFNKV